MCFAFDAVDWQSLKPAITGRKFGRSAGNNDPALIKAGCNRCQAGCQIYRITDHGSGKPYIRGAHDP